MESFWDSICHVLEKRHPTLKFKWELNVLNNGIDFHIEKSDGVYILVFFDNKYISYDTDDACAIVNHISHIILNKFQEDFTMESKKIFISRPMNGVSLEDDIKLVEEIREALIKEGTIGKSVNTELVNTWDGPFVPDGFSDEQTRVWMIGHSIQEMATADVLIFVDGSWASKGCAVEFEVYNRYKDIMKELWSAVLVYKPDEKTLTPLSEYTGRYPWGPSLSRCTDEAANLITDLINDGYPDELIEDAINLSSKILDFERLNDET